MLDGEQKGWDAAGKRVWRRRWWGEPLPCNVLAPTVRGERRVIPAPWVFVMGHHIPWISLHSPPSKGPTPAWAPRSPALLRHPVQVLARELAAAQEQERAQGCILNRRMGRPQWGPRQPGDAQVTLIPMARARCARRARLRDPR